MYWTGALSPFTDWWFWALAFEPAANKTNTDEYFRGERQIPWWAIGAIHYCHIVFRQPPCWADQERAFNHGFLYLQLQLGDLVGYLLVIALFLPFFVGLNLTTAYEYLEQRFDTKTRALGSLCFLLFVIARLGGCSTPLPWSWPPSLACPCGCHSTGGGGLGCVHHRRRNFRRRVD